MKKKPAPEVDDRVQLIEKKQLKGTVVSVTDDTYVFVKFDSIPDPVGCGTFRLEPEQV